MIQKIRKKSNKIHLIQKSSIKTDGAFFYGVFFDNCFKPLTFFNVFIKKRTILLIKLNTIHMKKILLAFLLGTATLAVGTSCTKEYITNSLPGISFTTNVTSNQWVEESPGIYSVNLDFPELDARYFDSGSVQVAIQLNSTPNTYDIVPATINNVHYSVNYAVGSVILFAENRNINPISPENMIVKVTLTDADNGGN